MADAAPCDHIVQLYQGQDFPNRAACRFTDAALTNGESSTLVRTLAHWTAIHAHLIPGEDHARPEMRILRRRIVPGLCLEHQSS